MKEKYHNLSSDIVFKFIFGYEKNKHYTEWLLERMFNLEKGSLKDKLIIQNSLDLDKSAADTHGLELDVRIKMPDNSLVNLEMYRNGFGIEEQEKSYAYLTTMFGTQLPKGSKFKNMKKCIQINFVKDKKYTKGKYKLLDKEKEYQSKGIELTIVNIDRPEMSCYDIDNELRKCFKLMSAESIEEARLIAQEGGIIEEMAKDIEKFNKDEWITDYFSVGTMWEGRVKELEETAELKLQEGIEQGMTQGISYGINQEKIETAKNLLKDNIEVEKIQKYTGLSLQEIEAITL